MGVCECVCGSGGRGGRVLKYKLGIYVPLTENEQSLIETGRLSERPLTGKTAILELKITKKRIMLTFYLHHLLV